MGPKIFVMAFSLVFIVFASDHAANERISQFTVAVAFLINKAPNSTYVHNLRNLENIIFVARKKKQQEKLS